MPLKILLADDSMTAQSMGKKILADAGYEVVAVSNGAAAVKKLAELKPDMVLLDVYMPGYSGLEVCEKIKGGPLSGQIPVLLTVGKMEPFRVEEGIKAKADGLIIKPFEATDLLTVVGKLAMLVRPQELSPKPVVEPPQIEEFEVPTAASHPFPAADAGFNMAAPAMPFDLLDETPAPAQPTLIITPPEKAELPGIPPAPSFDQLSTPGLPAQELANPSGAALSIHDLEAAVAQIAFAPEPAPSAEVSAAEEHFVIELPDFSNLADTAPAVIPDQAAASEPAPTLEIRLEPVAEEASAQIAPLPEPPSPQITLEPEPVSSEITLEFLDETAALDALAASSTVISPFPAVPSAPQPDTAAALPTTAADSMPPVWQAEAPAVEQQVAKPPIVASQLQPVPEPHVQLTPEIVEGGAGALETFEIHLGEVAATIEPQLEVTSATEVGEVAPDHALMLEREPVNIDIRPEPMLVGQEKVEVTPDSALITDIHDVSSYVSGVTPATPEQLSGNQVAQAEAVDDPAALDATVTSDLPDAPTVVEVLAEQTRYPALAEESPEFALFGPHGGSEAEVQCEARLSAALDAYDQAPEPAPERVSAQPVDLGEQPPAAEEPSAVTEHQIVAAPIASTSVTASVNATPSPGLEELVAGIVDRVIERLKPEILSELERRRSDLINEITKELNH